jgi:uncharacterized protein YprB with RNaseH-like and TPR domain
MRIATWDIETTHLKPNFGVVLCGAIKEYGKEPKLYAKKEKGKNDKALICTLRDELEKYDILVSYFGLNFDLKFLNSKLIHYNERPIAPRFHIDAYRTVKKIFNTSSRSLATITEYLHIPGKSRVTPELWMEAGYDGSEKALKEIMEHNKWDVIILEEVFKRIKYHIRGISVV